MSCTLITEEQIVKYAERYILLQVYPRSNHGTDIPALKKYLQMMFIKISEQIIEDTQLDLAAHCLTQLFASEDYSDLQQLLPAEGIKNALSKTYRSLVNPGKDVSMNNIDETETDFLDIKFGVLFDIKRLVKTKATRLLLESFIINRSLGRLISSTSDMNNEVRRIKQDLLNSVLEEKPLYDSQGNYTGVFEEEAKALGLIEDTIGTPTKIENLYRSNKEAFDKAINLFILKNFDNFVNLLLDSVITIKDNGTYDFKNFENSLIDTWRSGDNIDLTKEINKLTLMLINTTPLYENGTITDGFLRFEDFCIVISRIKAYKNYTETDGEDSITTLVQKAQIDPIKYTHKLMERLVEDDSSYFNSKEKDIIRSIYEGFFNPESLNSIFGITRSVGDYRAPNYYNLILQSLASMFLVEYLLFYQNEDGSIEVRNLRSIALDNVRRALETSIVQRNSRDSRYNYNEEIEEILSDGGLFIGVKKIITLDNGAILEISKGKDLYAIKLNNENYNKRSYIGSINDSKINEFIKQYLGIDLLEDTTFKEALLNTFYDETNLFFSLMDLVSEIMFNKYLSHVKFRDLKGKTDLENAFDEFYNVGDKPKFNFYLNEPNLISDKKLPILERIAQAKAKLFGQALTTIVKGSDGEGLNTTTLSRLLGTIESQHYRILEDEKNAASHFLIFKPGFKVGQFTTKDFKGISLNKDITKFSVVELFNAFFLHEFIGRNTKGKIITDGVAGFLPSVNSDKNTISSDLYDLKVRIGDKSLEQMSVMEIYELTMSELGKYYEKQLSKVHSDLEKLEVDYSDNFRKFNELARSLGITPYAYINELCRKYNEEHPTEPIALIDQTHFINEGGELKSNNTINALIARYNDKEKFIRFMQLKHKDILMDLTSDNITIDLTDGSQTSLYLRAAYPDWIGNNGFMILAKVIAPNGEIVDITNALNLKDYLRKHKTLGKVQLHPELEKYNALDYLLTQESLLAGVGSHTNHPIKIKLKTGAIFNNTKNNPAFVNYDEVALQMLSNGVGIEETFNYILNLAQKANKILETKLEQFKSYCSLESMSTLLNRVEENEIAEEAARFLAQHKRNVSWTAAMHIFLLNQVSGPPTKYNVAIMNDILFNLYTIHGNTETSKPFDGATFSNPFIVYLENYALNGDAAGTDKKPFVHFYDLATGTGGIIKTATFAVTNNRCRDDKFYRIMMKLMCDRQWFDEDGQPYIAPLLDGKKLNGILQDFEGNAMDYGIFYFKRGSKYYAREIIEYLGNNLYTIRTMEVSKEGNPISDPKEDIVLLNSNYAVWNVFGGYNSMELNRHGLLEFSEKSIQLTVKAMIGFGYKKTDIVTTASDVYQPMKYADIHYMPTVGAVKQGAANINSNKGFYDADEKLNWFQIIMQLAGILLDKEHTAEDSYLSLMTLVISAAAAKGYTLNQSSKLYTALYELTKLKTKEFRDELGILDSDNFDSAASNIILKHIINNTSSTDGNLLQVIAQELVQYFKDSKNLVLDKKFAREVDKHIPYSDSRIYRKILNILTSTLTKKGIKQTIPGNLAVLNPTQDIIKFYTVPVLENGLPTGLYKKVRYGKLEEYFDYYGVTSEEEVINKVLEEIQPISLVDVEIGNYYIITSIQPITNNEITEIVKVEMPHSIENDNLTTKEGIKIIGYRDLKNRTLTKIVPYNKFGNDLQSYKVTFSDGRNFYLLADLDIVQDYFGSKDYNSVIQHLNKYGILSIFTQYIKKDLSTNSKFSSIPEFLREFELNPELASTIVKKYGDFNADSMIEYIETIARKVLNIYMQQTLNAISKNSSMNTVIINEKPVTIDKSSIKVLSFGLVMPAIYRESLGISKDDDVQSIKADPLFFTKRLAAKFRSRIASYTDWEGNTFSNFNLELKRANGNHVYIKVGKQGLSDEFSKVEIHKETDEEGKIFRIDPTTGKRLYLLSSDSDLVYKDASGNEVIVIENDKTTWTDSSGKLLNIEYRDGKLYLDDVEILKAEDVYINSKTGEQVFKHHYSGIQFYLDNFEYASVYLNKFNDTKMFNTIIRHLSNSTNETALLIARLIHRDKSISDQLENFENPSEEIRWFVDKLIGYHGNRLYNSFLKSLHIIAARIPAQNQQSFMGMEVQDFEDGNVNSAYVSSFQFFLLGSDLDIDAVSLQVFKLNKQGLFVGHSPYYNLNSEELIEESAKLPYPTGKDLVENENGESTLDVFFDFFKAPTKLNAEDALLEGLFGISGDGLLKVIKNKENTVLKFDLNSINNIRQLKTLIEYLNKNGFTKLKNITKFIEDFNLIYGLSLTEQDVLELEKQLINLINKHNNYVKKSNFTKRESIALNYMTLLLYEIIIDPINQLEAQSSVDVIVGPMKNIAATSTKAKVQRTFTPGNFLNKFKSIVENMVGKDGIAICATGLKAFFGLTQAYNLTFAGNDIEEKKALLCSVKIGGKVYRGLANIVGEELNDEVIKDYLYEQFMASDMANEMSASLSLATDNAKELVLDKINANTYTLGMYLYGMSLGIPFKTMYLIMTSAFALRVTELVKGNVFSSKQVPIYNISGALDYFDNGPIFTEDFSSLKIDDKPLIQYVKDSVKTKTDIETIIQNIEKLRGVDVSVNLYIDAVLLYAYDYYLKERSSYETIYGYSRTSLDFELLSMGASELKIAGRIFSINLGIKDLTLQIHTIETLIDARIKQIRAFIRRGNSYNVEVENSRLSQAIKGKKYVDESFRFSLSRFLTDENYANEQIKLYDLIKMSYNPLRVIRDVPHYRGYVETLLLAQESIKSKSLKFVVSTELSTVYEHLWEIVNPKLKEQLLKNIESEISRVTIDNWLRSLYTTTKKGDATFKPIVINPGINIFIDDATKQKPLRHPMTIQLGTPLGNANYKVWFEEVVIPKLKQLYPENMFIQALDVVVNVNRTSKLKVSHIGLPNVNMLADTPYEKEILNSYRSEFNKLEDAFENNWLIKDLFYIYSLIVNGDRIGPTSLQSIFQDYALSGLPLRFVEYEIIQDRKVKDSKFVEEFKDQLDPFNFRVFATPYTSGIKVFRRFNRDTEEIEYWTRADENDEYVINGSTRENSPIVKGFNTNYFINSVRTQDLADKIDLESGVTLILTKDQELIDVVGDIDGKIFECLKGKILTRQLLKSDGTKETVLALDEINDLIKSIKECSV